jgi:hypothetical protein
MFWNVAHDFVLGVLASTTASLIGPYDAIGFSLAAIFAFIGIVRWQRARIKEGKRGMDSWYFIVLSLVVAVTAAGAAAYGVGLRSSSLSPSSAATAQKKYFPADIDARIKAIDRLDTIITGFQPILMQSQEFWNHIREMMGNGTATAALTKYENDATPLLDNMNSVLAEYRMRFPELDKVIKDDDYSYVVAIPYASSHMRDELVKWSSQPNFVQTIENTKTYDYWDKSIHAVQPWMEKSRRALAVLRQQYVSAEVYETGQQPNQTSTAPSDNKRYWPPLADDEAAKLRSKLRGLAKEPLSIWCNADNCRDIAETVRDAFHQANWGDPQIEESIFPLNFVGVSIAPDTEKTRALANAIEEATAGRIAVRVESEPTNDKMINVTFGRKR